MAEDISLKLTVDAVEGATSVKQLKELLKDAKDAALQFGEGSAEFAKFSQVAANAKDKIKDLNKTLDTLDPSGRGHAFQQMGGVMLGAFSAAQGAMALFGGESENLQKSLLKVQSAMALAQGFQQMQDGAKAFGAMKLMVTNVVTELGVMKTALIATGIGALAVVIGLVAANWDKVTAALFPANTQLQKNVDLAKDNYDTVHEENKQIELKTKMMKLNGDNEGTIAEWREKQYKKEADAVLLQIKAEELKLVMLKKQNDETKKSIEALGVIGKLGAGWVADKIFGKDDEIADTQKAIDGLVDSYANLAGMVLDAKLQLKDFNDKQDEANSKIKKQKDLIIDTAETIGTQLLTTVQDTQGNIEDALMHSMNAVSQFNKKMTADEIALEKQKVAAKIGLAKQGFEVIASFTELFGKKNEATARRAFQINKQAQAAQALISTYQGANAIFSSAAANPATVLFPAQPFIAAGLAIAAGLINVAKIEQQKFEGGSGGGGSAPSIGNLSPSSALNQSQPQTQLGGNNNNGGSNAAPVVIHNHISETEIRAVQQRNDMYAALATVH